MEVLCECGHTINEHTSGCIWSHYAVDASENAPLVCRCNLTPQDIARAREQRLVGLLQEAIWIVESAKFVDTGALKFRMRQALAAQTAEAREG